MSMHYNDDASGYDIGRVAGEKSERRRLKLYIHFLTDIIDKISRTSTDHKTRYEAHEALKKEPPMLD